jgi:hypothetical protein
VLNSSHQKYISSKRIRVPFLVAVALCVSAAVSFAAPPKSKILIRTETPASSKQKLASQLAEITGWSDLRFDGDGALISGTKTAASGSKAARDLINSAENGENLIVIEDASDRPDVVFCKVVPGRWTTTAEGKPPVYVVFVDFGDFNHLVGDRIARDSFNAGWGVMHELVHVVQNSIDAEEYGELGDCETVVNQMRRECGLAERGEYFFTFIPGMDSSTFRSKLVRLAFDEPPSDGGKRKRRWLVWDAAVVGGLPRQGQVASLRR